jgi:hypothetical protein
LFVAEPALLHVRHSPGLTDFSHLPWYGWWGAGQHQGASDQKRYKSNFRLG